VTAVQILDRLVELGRRIEEYEAAVYLCRLERQELQAELRRTAGWKLPDIENKSA
jgi:hypothetical protein